ncbi:MAG: ribonuclease P protein component 4 [Candidatus Bathyarchaeota archaeon]|nr:ribonuclease P protein component 4 [Candidatus Bathyarchaeota archaeon]
MNHEKQITKKIARERIEILMKLAQKSVHEDPDLAKRYVTLARKIGMKCQLRLPKNLKMFICKGCGNLLVPGTNCRVRLRSDNGSRVVLTCLKCNTVKRFPLTREKKLRKQK